MTIVDTPEVPTTTDMMPLPPAWEWTILGEVAAVNRRDALLRDLPDETIVTFVPMAAVDAESGTIANPEERLLNQVRKGFTSFADGDVIFAKITPCMENGKAAIAANLTNGVGFGSTEFHTLRPSEAVMSEWIFYFVRQQRFRDAAEASFTGTAGQLRVPTRFLEYHPLPLPPLAEQRRIVEAIETELTRLEAGVASLRAAQVKLRRYRASVLKAACEGRLVAQDLSDEPASALLQRILAERRERWAADLRAKGKDPAKARYEEPAPPDVAGLPELPAAWVWTRLDTVARVTSGFAFKSEEFVNTGVPVVKIGNVSHGSYALKQQEYLPVEFLADYADWIVSSGDLLFALTRPITNGMSKVCIYPTTELPGLLNQRVAKINALEVVDASYLYITFQSEQFKNQIEANLSQTLQPNLSPLVLERFAIPLPPLYEQQRIVAEVERRISVVAAMEAAVAANLKRAERLRQAILKRAFEGKLVPQDPSDEPASVLLERIMAARQQDGGIGLASNGRRGRPRKVEGETQASPEVAPKGNGRRGRPRKVEGVVQALAEAPPTGNGRRGRPRKNAAQPTGRPLPASEPVHEAEQLRIDGME